MEDSTKYLIIGGGLASVWAAQNIRERDKEGRLMIVGGEKHPPYDKPPLSKQYLAKDDYTADDAYSKFDNFYPDNNIILRTGTKVTGIDTSARTATLEDGGTIRYEKALLCTGASPRRLDVPGSDLQGIYHLRTVEDAEAIRLAMQHSRRGVFVGAGYLNMEAASGARERGIDVTVIEPQDRPWSRFASPTLGNFLRGYYEKQGVKFVFGDEATAFEGSGMVSAVLTRSGARFETDFVLISIGVTLNTDLAKSAGLQMDEKEGVVVDEYLQTSDPNIWAAGDIACFNDVALGKRWHAEHHLNAKWQGRAVGKVMAGERTPYDQVPYFFSDEFDIHMIQRGDTAVGWRNGTTVFGDLDGAEFVELYPDDAGILRMGVAISHEESRLDPISDKLEELIRAKASAKDLSAQEFGF